MIISRVGELVKRGNIVSQNQPFVHEVPVANGNCQLQIMAGTLDDPGRFHEICFNIIKQGSQLYSR